MALPIGTILAALGGGFLLKLGYDFFVKKPSLTAPLPGGLPAAMATVLIPQQIYALDMLVDSAQFAMSDPQNNAQSIADGWAQIGVVAIGPPQPRDPNETHKFQTKQPSRWMMLFRWEGQAGFPGAAPGYVKQFNVYTTPTSG